MAKSEWDEFAPVTQPAANEWDDFAPVQGTPTPTPAPARKTDSVLKRTLHGFVDPVIGAAQIADKLLVNPVRQMVSPGATSMADVTAERDAEYSAPEGFDVARMAGNVINPVSWAGGGAPGAAARFLPRSLAGRAAAAGATQAALGPVSADDYNDRFAASKVEQAGLGAVTGRVVSGVASGFRPTKEARALIRQGVQPTFGQSMGGVVNKVEQKLTSWPGIGDAVDFARNRAQKEFEQAVLNRAVGIKPPSGAKIPVKLPAGPRDIDAANRIASDQFDRVVPNLKMSLTDDATQAAAATAAKNPELTAQGRRVFNGIMADVLPPARVTLMTGEQLKQVDSQLGALTRKYSAGDPASQSIADSIRQVHQAFRQELDAMLPKGQTGALNEANTTWAKLVPVNKAASSNQAERITPRALQKALARQRQRDVSRMPYDPLVDSAVAVLPGTVADSGTAGRAALGLVGSGALGLTPEALMGTGLAFVGATRPVQRALVGNTAWQKYMQTHQGRMAAMTAAALRAQQEQQQ